MARKLQTLSSVLGEKQKLQLQRQELQKQLKPIQDQLTALHHREQKLVDLEVGLRMKEIATPCQNVKNTTPLTQRNLPRGCQLMGELRSDWTA